MTPCSLCAAIHHGHWCTYADVLFGQYCQKGAIEKSPCSPSRCPWRSTCCWNQKESSTETHRAGTGISLPGSIRLCGVPEIQAQSWHSPVRVSIGWPACKLGWHLLALLFHCTEKPQLQDAVCTGEAELENPPLQTPRTHTALFSQA